MINNSTCNFPFAPINVARFIIQHRITRNATLFAVIWVTAVYRITFHFSIATQMVPISFVESYHTESNNVIELSIDPFVDLLPRWPDTLSFEAPNCIRRWNDYFISWCASALAESTRTNRSIANKLTVEASFWRQINLSGTRFSLTSFSNPSPPPPPRSPFLCRETLDNVNLTPCFR